MTEKCTLDLSLVLPDLPDERDACVGRLTELLQAEGMEKVHLVREDGVARLCLHYGSAAIQREPGARVGVNGLRSGDSGRGAWIDMAKSLPLTGDARDAYNPCAMRYLLVILMLCLVPLQISWAAVAEYCGHEQEKTAQHFGHHDNEHKVFSAKPDPDKQPEKFNLGHDHCHISGFLGLLNESAFHSPAPPTQPSLRCNEAAYPSLALDRPERPKWPALA